MHMHNKTGVKAFNGLKWFLKQFSPTPKAFKLHQDSLCGQMRFEEEGVISGLHLKQIQQLQA